MQLEHTFSSVLVGTRNPAKLVATKAAVQRAWPRVSFDIQGVDSASGVPDQPVGDEQTLTGAVNRVKHIHQRLAQHLQQRQGPECLPSQPRGARSLLIAVEGGVLTRGQDELYCFAWAAVQLAGAGKVSTARSAEFLLPRQLAALVMDGMELGAADDLVFGRTQSGRGSGTVGKLTTGLVTRAAYYEHALLMALIPYMNPGLYPEYHVAAVE